MFELVQVPARVQYSRRPWWRQNPTPHGWSHDMTKVLEFGTALVQLLTAAAVMRRALGNRRQRQPSRDKG
jgi:hypothetical protein